MMKQLLLLLNFMLLLNIKVMAQNIILQIPNGLDNQNPQVSLGESNNPPSGRPHHSPSKEKTTLCILFMDSYNNISVTIEKDGMIIVSENNLSVINGDRLIYPLQNFENGCFTITIYTENRKLIYKKVVNI